MSNYPYWWDWKITQKMSTVRYRRALKRRKNGAVLAVYLYPNSRMCGVDFRGNGLEVSGASSVLTNTVIDSPRYRNTVLGAVLISVTRLLRMDDIRDALTENNNDE